MENWETDANSLNPHHFEFPTLFRSFMGVKANGATQISHGTGANRPRRANAPKVCRHDQLPPVARRYQPEPGALQELADVLYELLVDVPANEPSTASAPAQPTRIPLAIELWSDAAGCLFVVAIEGDARLGQPRGTVYTAAEMRRVVQDRRSRHCA
jgi:hypothetical protein